MKSWLLVGVLFAVLYLWFWLVDALVGRGMDAPEADAELSLDQQQAIADGYAVLPPAPVIFEPMDGIYVPPVRR